MALNKATANRAAALLAVVLLLVSIPGCIRYSFTGASIPAGVNTIYIPFFADRSNSGLGDLSDRLNDALVNRFINQSRLKLASSEDDADAVLDGSITAYSNRPFSISGDERASQNQVSITVSATFLYAENEKPEWSKSFSGSFNFDPADDPINGEQDAATEALKQISNNIFNDAVSNW